jgi:hypothetical protein
MSSNRQPEENENLLKSIASTVEIMRDRMATKDDLTRFATKDDLQSFATRDDLDRFATKEHLERFATKEDLERFSTKEDFDSLREQVSFLGGQVEDVRDRMATKNDLTRVEDRLGVETTAIRGDIEQVHLRLDGIDRSLALRLDHVESEMSRMRSVLYLLVKDRPDMLRLLGQAPPPAGG